MEEQFNNWPAWATEPIIVEHYCSEWIKNYNSLKTELINLYAFEAINFEHIGSTAVPFLTAKPIIDLMLPIDDFGDINKLTNVLEKADWYLLPTDLTGNALRRTFVKVIDSKRFAHFHLVLKDTGELERHIRFRDILRKDKAIADKYGQLKEALARIYKNDRATYSSEKTKFINAVLANKMI